MAWLERRHGKYRVCWRDDLGKTHRLKAYTDKTASKQLMAELEKSHAHGERGLINPFQKHNLRPLLEHVDEWIANLRERGKTDRYVEPCDARLHRLAKECDWSSLRDINADDFEQWREKATSNGAHNRKDKSEVVPTPMGPRTKNHYLESLRAFCNWCVKRKRMPSNPVAHIEKVDQTEDVRRERRALGEEEVSRLLAAVPVEYRLLYQVALCTGLRRGELLQLQWGDLQLSDEKPYIHLRAKTTKARRADAIPLRADLAELLIAERGNAADGDRLFRRVPRIKEHVRWLKAAKIPFKDADGRRADLHALRHTYGTLLSKAGVSPREAMELMRHTDLRQTMKVYTDPRIFNLSAAVEKLPINFANNTISAGNTGANAKSTSPGKRVAKRVANSDFQGQDPAVIGSQSDLNDSSQTLNQQQDMRELAGIGSDGQKAGDGSRTHNS